MPTRRFVDLRRPLYELLLSLQGVSGFTGAVDDATDLKAMAFGRERWLGVEIRDQDIAEYHQETGKSEGPAQNRDG